MHQNDKRSSQISGFNARHYDFVSDVWPIIYGDNFHAGYFTRPDETFKEATENLITVLAGLGTFCKESRVLDVGCGIGGPAIFLHEKYGCHVHGISISEKGVSKATEAAKRKSYDTHVTFSVRDAKDNQLPDASFDIVWAMESFHLIDDKRKAFSECYRVLKSGGQLLLCDNIAGQKTLSNADALKHYAELRLLERVFGKTRTDTLSGYEVAAREAGFRDLISRDINECTMPPTIEFFRKRVCSHYGELVARSSEKYIDDFLGMCNTWEQFNNEGFMSYGLLKGIKR